MKTKSTYLMILFLLLGIGCQKTTDVYLPEAQPDVTPAKGILKNSVDCEVDLIAGQNYIIGTVSTIFNMGADEVNIVYTITDPLWCLTEVKLDVQVDPENFPATRNGNPKIGHFAFGNSIPCEDAWSQEIDLTEMTGWTLGATLYIAAHGEVQSAFGQESIWAEGTSFPGNSWAMYFECTPPWVCGMPFVDERDGKEYNTVQIGDQCWMAENLAFLPTVSPPTTESNTECLSYVYGYYGNDVTEAKNTSNYVQYGTLYNWPAAINSCPEGWHVPDNSEWEELAQFISNEYGPYYIFGGDDWFGVGQHLKATSGWYNNGNGSDDVSFKGFPGGYMCSVQNNFLLLEIQGNWWSTQEYGSTYAWWRFTRHDSPHLGKWRVPKATSFSVRCIKD